MAKTDYGPEVKASMEKDTPADRARDKKRGIKEGSPQDQKIDANIGAQPSQRPPFMGHPAPMPGAQGAIAGNPENMARMQHAAGIAHAILGGRKMM